MKFLNRLFQLTLSVSVLATACAALPSVGANKSEPVQPMQTSEIVAPVTTVNINDLSRKCLRPYTDDSLWNVPIDWAKAKFHPDTDKMIAAFFKESNWVGSDVSKYSPNIYFVDNATPLIPVKLQEGRSPRIVNADSIIEYGESGGTVLIPIPAYARPASGTDGELTLINIDTGEEWGLIKGRILDAESWLAGGVYKYSVYSSGIPPEGFAQRGAGLGSFAGIVRPCEVERGYIGHAVTIAYDYPCKPEVCAANGWPPFIPPFTKTDGIGATQFDIPEGARLVIKPEIAKDEILRACSGVQGCIVWTLNMQEYGGFIVDNSGHPKTYGEGNATAHWDAAIWSEDMLRNIPPDWYAVIDWNYPAVSVP
ncbi:MAG: hypothetical protein B6D38_10325 [Anaerolineae bacterium UTCFX1]|jgi:hypothetical protein|nr:MAG: hypothetical protein B6D38_10325 [Anaerolineae bacterium UTCFX1]